MRKAIARVGNIIRILAIHFVPLTDTVLAEAYEWVVEQEPDCGVKDEIGRIAELSEDGCGLFAWITC